MTKILHREIFPIFLLLIIIIALVGSIVYFQKQTDNAREHASNLESQLNNLQNPTYNVTIANVSAGSWGNPVGMALGKQFYFTIRNNGETDIGGLMTEFVILDNGNVSNSDEFEVRMYSPEQFGIIHAHESTVISVDVMTSYSVSRAGKSLVVTLMLDTIVLDERTLNLAVWEGV